MFYGIQFLCTSLCTDNKAYSDCDCDSIVWICSSWGQCMAWKQFKQLYWVSISLLTAEMELLLFLFPCILYVLLTFIVPTILRVKNLCPWSTSWMRQSVFSRRALQSRSVWARSNIFAQLLAGFVKDRVWIGSCWGAESIYRENTVAWFSPIDTDIILWIILDSFISTCSLTSLLVGHKMWI